MKYYSAMERMDGKMVPRRAYGIEFIESGQLYAMGFDRPALALHMEMLSNVIGSDKVRLITLKVVR